MKTYYTMKWRQTVQSRCVWLHIIPVHTYLLCNTIILKYMSKYHNKYETKDVSCSATPPIQNHNATNPELPIWNYLFQTNNIHLSCQHLKRYSFFIKKKRGTWKTQAVKFSNQSSWIRNRYIIVHTEGQVSIYIFYVTILTIQFNCSYLCI